MADPALAKTLLQAQVTAGKGNTLIFAGQVDAYGYSAERTISDLLTDTDVLTTSNSAAASIAAQIAVLKQETGIVDSEILRLPVLFWTVSNYAVAYTPGLVNGISLGDAHFGPPRPHGPVVNGRDIFEVQAETEFAKVGITVNWIEDWDLYHVSDGEVHCGSNTTRQVPATERWWESGL